MAREIYQWQNMIWSLSKETATARYLTSYWTSDIGSKETGKWYEMKELQFNSQLFSQNANFGKNDKKFMKKKKTKYFMWSPSPFEFVNISQIFSTGLAPKQIIFPSQFHWVSTEVLENGW